MQDRLGVWLIGARGAVATTTMVGAAALARGAIDAAGMVTAHPPLDALPLAPVESLVFGGHDIRALPLDECARALLREAGPLRAELIDAEFLRAVESNLRPAPETRGRAFIEQVQRDLTEFLETHGLRRIIVVNLATTEALFAALHPAGTAPHQQAAAAHQHNLDDLPVSALYAHAAVDAGHPYINFTPSHGATGLEDLARERGVPIAGHDGKTGETLLKSALAPMFAMRKLRVKSWTGYNVLGNADGESLTNPEIAASKTATKAGGLPQILGYAPHALVRIDYVPPLGDWKTAWDLVQFDGFLGTPMTLQLTWQGSDSALAAPLVLDLVRLVDLAATRGESGVLGWLAFFFKSPDGSDVHDLPTQHANLLRHLCG